ncbi:MAG: C1 family peptidase [Hyphomonadaceae bacterium]
MTIAIVKDLRGRFGVARDQRERPTCIAFAISDAHSAVRGQTDPLSVEHLYYHAVQRSAKPDPDAGVTFADILTALRDDGQCAEPGWPYLDVLPSDIAQWTPPATAQPLFTRDSERPATSVDAIIENLDNDRAVVVGLRLGERFYDPVSGVIDVGPDDNDTTYHAVIGVGYGTMGAKRAIYVRNSWGEDWGENGYAWVTEEYLDARLFLLARLT